MVHLCVLLWPRPGKAVALRTYEDAVLSLVAEHRGVVTARVQTVGDDVGQPHEVQLLDFATRADLDAYLADPRRTALADQRDAAITRTEVIEVTPVR